MAQTDGQAPSNTASAAPAAAPGSVVSPGGNSVPPTPAPPPVAPPPPAPAQLPDPESRSAADSPAPVAGPTESLPPAGIESLTDDQSDPTDQPASETVSWTASEFAAHDKTAGWYILLAIGTLLLAGITVLLIRDIVSVSVVVIAGLILGIYAAHKPRQLQYAVSSRGLSVDGKQRDYSEFRSFSVVSEGALSSLIFMPLKRFAVPLTIYYPIEDEEQILSLVSSQLPLEEYNHDAVDRLIRRMRF